MDKEEVREKMEQLGFVFHPRGDTLEFYLIDTPQQRRMVSALEDLMAGYSTYALHLYAADTHIDFLREGAEEWLLG